MEIKSEQLKERQNQQLTVLTHIKKTGQYKRAKASRLTIVVLSIVAQWFAMTI